MPKFLAELATIGVTEQAGAGSSASCGSEIRLEQTIPGLGLRKSIEERRVRGGSTICYADVVAQWNNDPSTQRGSQASRLRMTPGGQRFAYARRNDAQRRRCFARIKNAFPTYNTRNTWTDYFRYIAKGLVPFPARQSAFRPTLDWALKISRFEAFLQLRHERKCTPVLDRP